MERFTELITRVDSLESHHLVTVAAIGLAAMDLKAARKAHAENEEQVRRGVAGQGALETTVRPLREAEETFNTITLAYQNSLEAERARREEQAKAQQEQSQQDAGNIVNAKPDTDLGGSYTVQTSADSTTANTVDGIGSAQAEAEQRTAEPVTS